MSDRSGTSDSSAIQQVQVSSNVRQKFGLYSLHRSPLLLNVADGELWTDVGWTKIESTTKHDRNVGTANEKRSIGIKNYEGTAMHGTARNGNVMDTEHCKYGGNGECGPMCDREHRKLNQRLKEEIEHIDWCAHI